MSLSPRDLWELIQSAPSDFICIEFYKRIPGTKDWYREDKANSSTRVDVHAHVYAGPKRNGKEWYSVNKDGTGRHGSSGKRIPKAHADFFRERGYNIPEDNILRCLDLMDVWRISVPLMLIIILESPGERQESDEFGEEE